MLFNSYPFVFVYLPLALLGYQIAAHFYRRAVVIWLTLASLAFYAYWSTTYLLLLCGSILFNYVAGACISRKIPNRIPTRAILWLAIAGNLATLCYYKYLFPFLGFVATWSRIPHSWRDVILPLGISFFTFTQIAYLVDLEQGAATQQDLASYSLFVTFFPHLIAGPIIHHAEIMPQFQSNRDYRLRIDDMAVGFSWFAMGLAKKVLLADHFALAANAAFSTPASLRTSQAWIGVLSYALQLYFDFSGYSDMALGLARMFSIQFPLNFSSPYKASNIIDFWQRWHITLTRYIMSYLYNPVSMAIFRRRIAHGQKTSKKAMATPGGFFSMIAIPMTVTLFLAGIWHGAGMQFIIFGLLHAGYLTINHAWRVWRGARPLIAEPGRLLAAFTRTGNTLLTFAAVIVAQVFFRSSSANSAVSMLGAMLGSHPLVHPSATAIPMPAIFASLVSLVVGFIIVWTMPNTQQILARFKPGLHLTLYDSSRTLFRFYWRPTTAWALGLGALLLLTIIRMQDKTTFLYFQF
jgi:alginate O-acetyltransferase complex protein AlgI